MTRPGRGQQQGGPRPPSTGSLRGLATRGGVPVAGASVYCVSGPGPAPDIAALTDARGAFQLDDLAAGRWRLRVGDVEIEADVRAGERSTIDVELP